MTFYLSSVLADLILGSCNKPRYYRGYLIMNSQDHRYDFRNAFFILLAIQIYIYMLPAPDLGEIWTGSKGYTGTLHNQSIHRYSLCGLKKGGD